MCYIINKEMIQMKPLENLNFEKKEVVHLQSVEEKLAESAAGFLGKHMEG